MPQCLGVGLRLSFFICCGVFSFWIFYPGALTLDAATSLSQALSGEIRDHHPPILAVLWSAILYLGGGMPGMLVLQCGLYWMGIFLISEYGFRSLGLTWLWGVAIGFFPPLFSYVGVLGKDMGLVAGGLAAFGLLVFAEHKKSRAAAYASCLPLIYAAWVRHNGIVILLPFSIFLVASLAKLHRRELGLAVATILGLLLSALVMAGNLAFMRSVSKRDYPLQQLLTYELTGISLRAGENVMPVYWKRLTLQHLEGLYSPAGNAKTFWTGLWPPSIPDPSLQLKVSKTTGPRIARLPFAMKHPEAIEELKAAWILVLRHAWILGLVVKRDLAMI